MRVLQALSIQMGSGSETFAAGPLDQLMIGGGFQECFPRVGFGGNVCAVVTGRGAPTAAELSVLDAIWRQLRELGKTSPEPA